MKNSQRKKISLDKIKIARLDHLDKFNGGSQDTTDQVTNIVNCFTKLTICKTQGDCNVSTKTIALSGDIHCLTI
ncbi:hypothetical protein D1815_02860 [Aquimarina sp. AD1]|uniref:hypothetical protein n=1 Tax=unclassified Aquimarina TaxID=2627091 RepID=UPI000D54D397|nr:MULTISPECIES: hypothetical protein [unclassified Aquimarina]AXT54739.1 hypothetical protein D1815_02860 [Aquimarina sp. AD1]RKN01552.1 hypothetical protein D7035_23305 [Aquimarina sp. AD1]